MNRDESCRVAVIIPALNEAETTRTTIQRIPYPPGHVIVADNGSRDGTPRLAAEAGARVLRVPHRGYGRACLAGIDAAWDADVLVFLDADLSEDPGDIPLLVGPIARGEVDLVLGARTGQSRPWHARAGTALCVWLINRLWGTAYEDLGPFSAIRGSSLRALGMRDGTWGWTIEMQVKAAECPLRWVEVPVASGPGGRTLQDLGLCLRNDTSRGTHARDHPAPPPDTTPARLLATGRADGTDGPVRIALTAGRDLETEALQVLVIVLLHHRHHRLGTEPRWPAADSNCDPRWRHVPKELFDLRKEVGRVPGGEPAYLTSHKSAAVLPYPPDRSSTMTDRKSQHEMIDPESPERRAFTQQAILALLSGVTVTITGCGDSDSPTSPTPGPSDVLGSVSANHGHTAVIESARLTGSSAVALNIRGDATHPHTVELSSQEVSQIAARQRVSKASSTDDSPDAGRHNHVVTFN